MSFFVLNEWMNEWIEYKVGHLPRLEDESLSVVHYIYTMNRHFRVLDSMKTKSNISCLEMSVSSQISSLCGHYCIKHTSQMCFDSHTNQM